MTGSDSMDAECGTVAGWTAEVAERLGPRYRIPAACSVWGGPTEAVVLWGLKGLSSGWCPTEVSGMEIKIVLDLPRDAVSVPVSRQVLDGCLKTLGVTPDTRADIALALSEACANVIQHAGTGEEYEVQVSARNCRCAIEVVNAGSRDSEPAPDGIGTAAFQDGRPPGGERPEGFALAGDAVSAMAEHGRGLKIIDAVTDNLRLTGNQRQGTTVHFEKTLEWLPGSAGQHLFNAADGA